MTKLLTPARPSQAASRPKRLTLRPRDYGRLLTAKEFDRARVAGDCLHRFELIRGVVIVSPPPANSVADPNEEFGCWLRTHQQRHPEGRRLDVTLPGLHAYLGQDRLLIDRQLWIGLGRLPQRTEHCAIAVDFVSAAKRRRTLDHLVKRRELEKVGIKEYWLIDRFQLKMTVWRQGLEGGLIVKENEIYLTPLLPGFELDLGKLLFLANRWGS